MLHGVAVAQVGPVRRELVYDIFQSPVAELGAQHQMHIGAGGDAISRQASANKAAASGDQDPIGHITRPSLCGSRLFRDSRRTNQLFRVVPRRVRRAVSIPGRFELSRPTDTGVESRWLL